MYYLLNLLLIIVYYFFITKIKVNHNKRNKYFINIVCIHAILFRVFANPMNYVDTDGYAYAFEYISTNSLEESVLGVYSTWGVGYVALNWVLSRISTNPMILFTFLSIVTVGGIILFYKKNSYAYFITILFFLLHPMLYYQGFGVVRQHFAIVFLLWALYYSDNNKIMLLLSIVAFLMHPSCIVIFPFLLWRKIPFAKRGLFFFILFTIVGLIVMRATMSMVLSFLPRYEENGFGGDGDNNIIPVFLLGFVIIVMFISGTYKHLKLKKEKNILSFILYGFVVAIFGIGMQGAGRLTLPFIYVLPVFLSYLYKYSKHIKVYYYSCLCIIFGLLFLMLYIYRMTL